MTRGLVTVNNQAGLHARAAVRFVNLATTFQAQIRLRRDNLEVNGKSILGILQLGAAHGTRLQLITEGDDEEDAFRRLKAMIEGGFGESY
jgi:phosphocarrier protein